MIREAASSFPGRRAVLPGPSAPAPGPAGDVDPALVSQAGRSAAWAMLQSGGKHLIDLGVFLLLAKLVAPGEFGLVAMAGVFVVLVNVLAELGLGEALVQRGQLDDGHLDTAFWFSLALGGGLAALTVLAAPWIAGLYGRSELADILRAMTPLFVFNALTIVPQAVLQRRFGFRALALRSLAGSVAGGSCGLAIALQGGGAWSLVAQQLVAGGVGLVGLWLQARWRPGVQVSAQRLGELARFGRNVVGAKVLNVAASKADDLVVGLVLGPVALGFYSVACRMLLALEQLFCQGVDAVALSTFSKAGKRKDELVWLFLSASRLAATLALPVFAGVMLAAPEILLALIGPQWMPSAPVLQVLLVAGILHSLMHFNHAMFKACGRPEYSLRIAAASTLLNVVTLLVAVRFGLVAVAVSYVVRSALIAPVGLVLVGRLVGLRAGDYARAIGQPLLAIGAGAAAALVILRQGDAILPPGALLLVSLLGMGTAYVLWLRVFAGPRLGIEFAGGRPGNSPPPHAQG